MSEPKWTSAQSEAINARGSNILVSAAAGSGKTAVLSERVVREILDSSCGVSLDRLLIVTFTNAAAAEMKTRISKKISDEIKAHPNNVHALKQQLMLPTAQICTIDSFCINLVRENFFKLGIEQDFKILENSESQLLEKDVIENIIEELYETGSDEFKGLVELFSTTKNDAELINTVLKINNYISSQPFPISWLENVAEFYNPEKSIDESEIKEYIVDEITFILDYVKEIIEFEKSLLIADGDMYEEYFEMISGDEKIIEGFRSSLGGTWDEIVEASKTLKFKSITRVKKNKYVPYYETLKEKRNTYSSSNGVFSDISKKLLTVNSVDFKEDNEYLYPIFKSLIELIKKFNSNLLERKKELNSFTFSDIEHFAIELLFYQDEDGTFKRRELALELENMYDEILVDEYQDTNAAQDKLFEMLSNGHNRFMVGDIKQSIYRFRLAMPEIFSRKKDEFTPYNEDGEEVNQKIILDKNFRSKEGICRYTNFLFSKLMSKKIGELDYREEDYLYNGSEFIENGVPCVNVNIVDLPENCENKAEYEARQVAEFIINKVNKKEQINADKNQRTRDITFGDFAVLFRSAKTSMPVYAKVFSEYGIPTVANNRLNLFENKEVAILISLLKTVDNPALDIPLLATLTSVFYGYSAEEIAKAKINKKSGNLYSAISGDETFKAFLSDMDKYKKYASSMSVESFLMQIINDSSYLSLISVLGNFEQRRLNVLKLIEIAKRFDNGENVGLTAFIRYIDRIIESKLDVESAEINLSDNNCVSLMSVHKSKGLEFPVVILADAAHKYNKEDERAAVLLNNELGVGLKVNNEEKLYRYNSLQYTTLKTVNSNASMSENLRVLYVAVTRAKEQFVAFMSYKNAAEDIRKIGSKIIKNSINPLVIRKTQTDAELILMTALMHPDCSDLRSFCTGEIETDDNFKFELKADVISEKENETVSEEVEFLPDSEIVDGIKEKLSFSYKRSELSSYSSKRAASSLDEREHSFKYFAKTKPAFLSGTNLTAAQKGTAMHSFMQYCIYENARDDLEKEIERLYDLSYLTQTECDSLNREKLKNLFNSDFAKRMFESDKLYREINVSSLVPVNELEETEFDEKVLVQGVADCVFEEDGKLVLVDYKTDFVKSETELLDLYKRQIMFYKNAVSKTLNKEVKEAMLYSFCLDKPCVYR